MTDSVSQSPDPVAEAAAADGGESAGTSREQIRARLVRRGWLSALIIASGAGAGYGYGAASPATYTAQAYIVATAKTPADTVSATAFATAYSRIAGQPQILDAAATASSYSVKTLSADTAAALSPHAPVIAISGTAHEAADAAAQANAVANALVALATAHETNTTVSLTLLSAAQAPITPSSPSAKLDAAIGGGVGLLLTALAGLAGVGSGEGSSSRRRRSSARPSPAAAAAAADPDEHPSPLGTIAPQSGMRVRASVSEAASGFNYSGRDPGQQSEEQGVR
jgi:capsular polysaccharide biosynthesis protein